MNSGEYKLMGLAPYGEPRFVDAIYKQLIDLRDDGSFTVDQRYFDYLGGLTMTNDAFSSLVGGPPRSPESPLTQREMDLARSIQVVCEEVVERMARTAVRATGHDSLCLAGGVALNAVANGKLLRESCGATSLDSTGRRRRRRPHWAPRFSRGTGTSRGERAADDVHDRMQGSLLGPQYDEAAVASALRAAGRARSSDWDARRPSRRLPTSCRAAPSSAGSTVAWNSARGRSAHAAFSPTHVGQTCRPRST